MSTVEGLNEPVKYVQSHKIQAAQRVGTNSAVHDSGVHGDYSAVARSCEP